MVAGELLEVTSVRRDAHLRLPKNGPSRELLKELRSLSVMWETEHPADSASATVLFRGIYPKIATDVAAEALQRHNAMLLDQERSRKRPAGPSSNQQLAKRSARIALDGTTVVLLLEMILPGRCPPFLLRVGVVLPGRMPGNMPRLGRI